jgi:hypothetical protein
MEKRAGERYKVSRGFKARVNEEKEVTIKDISICGMCLECPTCLIPNNTYTFKLPSLNDETITTKGVVVRSFLKSMHEAASSTYPLYHAGIKFIGLGSSEKNYLERLFGNVTV